MRPLVLGLLIEGLLTLSAYGGELPRAAVVTRALPVAAAPADVPAADFTPPGYGPAPPGYEWRPDSRGPGGWGLFQKTPNDSGVVPGVTTPPRPFPPSRPSLPTPGGSRYGWWAQDSTRDTTAPGAVTSPPPAAVPGSSAVTTPTAPTPTVALGADPFGVTNCPPGSG